RRLERVRQPKASAAVPERQHKLSRWAMRPPARPMIRFVLAIVLVCAASAATAQAIQKMPRVGVLYMGGPLSSEDSSIGFGRGMRELGYVAGQNVVLDYRYAEGRPEQLATLAAQLVAAHVDVILAAGPGPLAAAQQATTTIPIVTVA